MSIAASIAQADKQASRMLGRRAGQNALADALVGEARLSFGLHQRLFDELAVACAIVPPGEV